MNPPATDEESYELPSADALLAGSLALMTGHAQCGCARQRSLMARKVRSNLFFLAQHPHVNAQFRTVIQRLHDHWDQLVQATAAAAFLENTDNASLLPESRLWHPPAERMQ